jgi:hypothetical protein
LLFWQKMAVFDLYNKEIEQKIALFSSICQFLLQNTYNFSIFAFLLANILSSNAVHFAISSPT